MVSGQRTQVRVDRKKLGPALDIQTMDSFQGEETGTEKGVESSGAVETCQGKPDREGAALPGKPWGRPEGRKKSRGLRQRAVVNWNCPPLI